jgi:hypothetical protein
MEGGYRGMPEMQQAVFQCWSSPDYVVAARLRDKLALSEDGFS